MSLRDKKTAILCKAEATYGVDPTPTGPANGMMMFNAKLGPMKGQMVDRRPAVPYFRAPQKMPTKLYRSLTGFTDLTGHVTKGTAPMWSPIAKSSALNEVAVASTSVTYTPSTDNIGSATYYFNLDGVQHKFRGARSNGTLVVTPHELPRIEWNIMGFYETPTDVALPSPTLTNWQDPQVVNFEQTPTFTVNGAALELKEFRLDLGDQVVYRNRPNGRQIMIVDRVPSIKVITSAENMATFNPFLLAENQTSFAISLVHGVGAGRVVTISVPNARMSLPDDYSEEDGLTDIPMDIVPLPTSGNDEFSIAFT